MAHTAPFVARLDPAVRDDVVDRALEMLGEPPTLVRRIIILTAVV